MILPLKNIWKFGSWFCGVGFTEKGYYECVQYQSTWDDRTSHYRYSFGIRRNLPLYEGIQIVWHEGNLFGFKEQKKIRDESIGKLIEAPF